jgi:hypothetical protein
VLAEKPSHAWWQPEGELGSAYEVGHAARWQPEQPGLWQPLLRRFRDGHTERWWGVEAECRPYGPEKGARLVIASTDPATLPEATTWYLVTNRPAPGGASPHPHPPASVTAVVHLYGLRMWVEQSYKQVKQTLGWAEYQVCADVAIRRHWHLVYCAFAFCWWAETQAAAPGWAWPGRAGQPVLEERAQEAQAASALPAAGKKKPRRPQASRRAGLLARGAAARPRLAGAGDHAVALVAGVVSSAPTPCPSAAPGVAVGGTWD